MMSSKRIATIGVDIVERVSRAEPDGAWPIIALAGLPQFRPSVAISWL